MIEKEFIPYEEALALKELGFNKKCLGYYLYPNNALSIRDLLITTDYVSLFHFDVSSCKAPTFSQAFRWFDEHTDLMGFVVPSIKDNHFDWLIRIDWEEEIECEEAYTSRIEAELACLKQLIKIAKEKQNEQTKTR